MDEHMGVVMNVDTERLYKIVQDINALNQKLTGIKSQPPAASPEDIKNELAREILRELVRRDTWTCGAVRRGKKLRYCRYCTGADASDGTFIHALDCLWLAILRVTEGEV